METKLARISQLSKENPDMVFTSLGHLINKEMLKSCHAQMDGTKAVGIDGITKEEYGRRLEENISALIERLKKKSYKPKPARLVEIPKDNGKMRPLSIYCYEDKLVQEALRRILEAVFEPIFYDEMMGFRPNRGCHKAIRKLNLMLERKPTSYVLDADIKGFFQHLDHEWIIRFIGSRIKDPNIIRLVRRMLKAGIMNNYEFEETEEGSGQGSVCSPVISCIYMHYVLVWWFKEVITPKLKMIPGVYAVSSGGLSPSINLDTHQFQEILLTAGQSIFAVALLLDLRLHVREAFWLLVLFAAQLLSPLYDAQLEAMLGLAHDPLRLHYFYAQVYLALAAILMIKNWRKVWQLRLGFKV